MSVGGVAWRYVFELCVIVIILVNAVVKVAGEAVGYREYKVADAGRDRRPIPHQLQRESLRLQRLLRPQQPPQPQRAPP